MGLDDVEAAAMLVQGAAHPEANIIFGASFDDSLDDEIVVTVIATGFDDKKQPESAPARGVFSAAAGKSASASNASREKPKVDTSNIDDIDEIFKIFNK